MSLDTRNELVTELRNIRDQVPSVAEKINGLMEQARRGAFHNFKSTDPYPKATLVEALRALPPHGLLPHFVGSLISRINTGEFDEKPDADDRMRMARDLASAPALRRQLGLPDPVNR